MLNIGFQHFPSKDSSTTVLLPCHGTNERNSPDVMVIGFQEIVPLTAQQIVQTDPEKKFCGSRP
jgi:hypothetical protein